LKEEEEEATFKSKIIMSVNKKEEIHMESLSSLPPPAYNSPNHYPIVYQPTVYSINQQSMGSQMAIHTHLGWSILNTICCLCIGSLILFCSIPAMIFSFKTAEHLRFEKFDLKYFFLLSNE
jgi:hypothetical protein